MIFTQCIVKTITAIEEIVTETADDSDAECGKNNEKIENLCNNSNQDITVSTSTVGREIGVQCDLREHMKDVSVQTEKFFETVDESDNNNCEARRRKTFLRLGLPKKLRKL